MKIFSRFGAGCLVSLVLCAVPVQAQWDPGATASLGAGMGPINLMTGNLNLGRISLAERSAAANGTGTANRPASSGNASGVLLFTSSPVVSADIRQKMIQSTVAHAAPEKRTQLQSAWAHIDPVAGVGKVLVQHGYSANNLADVMAMYWIICWQLVHGTPDPAPATIQAVDGQLRHSLLSNPSFAKLSNESKQRLAEVLAYQTYFGIVASRADAANREQVKASLTSQFQQIAGLDLNRLDLKPSGFVEK
jgi:hypothetical protein